MGNKSKWLFICLDFTCPTDKVEDTVNIRAEDTFAFNTNKGPKYSKNMNCQVNYFMEASCQKIKMTCKTFRLGTGDFLTVKKGNTQIK